MVADLLFAKSWNRPDPNRLWPACDHCTNVAFEKPHSGVAFERFTESGPLAVLPLADFRGSNRGSLVWTISEPSREELPQP